MFLVRDTASPTGRLLALKILLPSLASNEDFLKMFFTEAKIAAQLQHKNIVGITGFGQVNGIHCLAMEYVFGSSLAQVLRASARAKRPLTVGVLLRITSEVCDALHYAHELCDERGQHLGLVHRDVTPQNILIGFNGAPKLTDFGIAKATNRGWETQAGIVKGKFSYMSPEQALGKKVDRRSDIFGAGIVLWEALTGRDLFKGSTPMEVLTAIREQKIQPPSKVVPGLTPIVDPIVMKALKRSPRQRYQSAAEMRDDIEDLIRRAGVSIDANTISKEFGTIYGDDIVEKAFALRTAMAGKADLANLAKAMGGSLLEPKHLPEFRGGMNDPDPLGLFTDSPPVEPADDGINFALPARTDKSFSRAPAVTDEFEIVDGSSLEDEEDLISFDVDEKRNVDALVPQERIVNGWEDSTAMSVSPGDDLLSMLSEEDATIGFLPPEFADRFGQELRQALEEEDAEASHFDDELTIGMPNSPELAELRALSEEHSNVIEWDDPYPEPAMPGARTEALQALPSSYGLRPVQAPARRAPPRAPSLSFERPVPRAPSLDLDRSGPAAPSEDSLEEMPIPSRPPLKAPPPPPPPAPSAPVEVSPDVDFTDPVEEFQPNLNDYAPMSDMDEVPHSMPGEVVISEMVESPLHLANSAPPRPLSAPGGVELPGSNADALSPEALRALATAQESTNSAPPARMDSASSESLLTVPPPAQGLRVSPMFLILGGLLLVALGTAIGLVVATS